MLLLVHDNLHCVVTDTNDPTCVDVCVQDKDVIGVWQTALCWSASACPDKTQSLLEVQQLALHCTTSSVERYL